MVKKKRQAKENSCKKIIIRKSSRIDIIHRLDREVFPDDTYSELLDVLWFIAWCDGEPAGFAGVKPTGGGKAFLIRCGVREEFRGLGLQSKFLKVREKAARQNGIEMLYTYTLTSNHHSSNNLIKNGYLLYDGKYMDSDEVLYWKKELK